MSRRWWMLSGLLFVLTLGAATLLRARDRRAIAPTSLSPEKFEQIGWRSGSAVRRIGMARHMTISGELIGRNKDELTALLGPPRDGDCQHLNWFLGERQSGASLMFPYKDGLVVLLDERGLCTQASIVNMD